MSKARWISKFRSEKNSWIFVPTQESYKHGKKIIQEIKEKWTIPSYYFHFQSGGHVSALNNHILHNYFIHYDICNFFSSINRSRITRCFKKIFPYHKARSIAIESSVRQPDVNPPKYILPFGFPQSPIIASYCLRMSGLGVLLEKISRDKDFSLSVYMDDIIISSNNIDRIKEKSLLIETKSKKSNFFFHHYLDENLNLKQTEAFNIILKNKEIVISNEKFKDFQNRYQICLNENKRTGISSYIKSVNIEQYEEIIK